MIATRHGGTALLFSPLLDGHRQVYVASFADFLLARGFSVVVATDPADLRRGLPFPHIDRLVTDPRVQLVDVSTELDQVPTMRLARLVALVNHVGAQVTVLLEADNDLRLLTEQIWPSASRIPGRRVGVFIRSTNFIYGDDPPTSLKNRVGRVVRFPREWPNHRRLSLDTLLPRFHLLDAALCIDEAFVACHGTPYAWLPDISQVPDCDEENPDGETSRWSKLLNQFLAKNVGKPAVLYYGTEQPRRGYDVVLKLAVEEQACFIHCGARLTRGARQADAQLKAARGGYEADVQSLLATLREQGSLFETGEYISGFGAAKMFFQAARCVVLPYSRHYGSSGVMLQALSASRPVLVPDRGLMAQRVRSHGLGLTYTAGDWADLKRQFENLIRSPQDEFATTIRRFMGYFSRDQVHAALSFAVCDAGLGATLPWRETPILEAVADA